MTSTYKRAGLMAALMLISAPSETAWAQEPVPSAGPANIRAREELHSCRPGPWGRLDYFHMNIEAPESFITESSIPPQQTVWRFVGMSAAETSDFFKSLELAPELLDELFKRSGLYTSDMETRILPSANLILGLSPSQRQKLYAVARPWRDSGIFFKPIIVEYNTVEQWFAGLNLPAHIPALIQKTAYPQGSGTAFSDVPFLLSQMETEEQSRNFLKALTRTRSIVLRLRIDPADDLAAVAAYWSSGGQYKDALPLLNSVARTDGVATLDVTHFLPPLARKYLYTFPNPSAGFSGRFPGGFWTAFNFFEFWPEEETPWDSKGIEDRLRKQFTLAKDLGKFGDLIVLRDPNDGSPMHACVYIADDIVYTKNGASVFRPWTMMTLDAMLMRWSHRGAPLLEHWHRKR